MGETPIPPAQPLRSPRSLPTPKRRARRSVLGKPPQTPGPAGHDGGRPPIPPGPAGRDGGDPHTPGPAGSGAAADALRLARGDVRDGVASIEHFLQVLGSRRVGPRVLARSVPEVLAGCAPLHRALASLGGAFAAELTADPAGVAAAKSLLAHAAGRVDQLAAVLTAHEGASSLDARERLALESIVRRVAGELGSVVRLADLLGAGVTSETTTIDLVDALAQRRARGRTSGTQVLASVEVRERELTVGDARLVLDLLELAVAAVVRGGVTAVRIVADLGSEGFPVFTVGAAPEEAEAPAGAPRGDGQVRQVLDVVLREELPHESDVVRAAARHAGITMTFADDRRTVVIAL